MDNEKARFSVFAEMPLNETKPLLRVVLPEFEFTIVMPTEVGIHFYS